MKAVAGVKKYTYKKNGYLLIEIVVASAVASILLLSIFGSFSFTIRNNRKNLEFESTMNIMKAIENDFRFNVDFEELSNNVDSNVSLGELVNKNEIEKNYGKIKDMKIDIVEINDDVLNIKICNSVYNKTFEVKRYRGVQE